MATFGVKGANMQPRWDVRGVKRTCTFSLIVRRLQWRDYSSFHITHGIYSRGSTDRLDVITCCYSSNPKNGWMQKRRSVECWVWKMRSSTSFLWKCGVLHLVLWKMELWFPAAWNFPGHDGARWRVLTSVALNTVLFSLLATTQRELVWAPMVRTVRQGWDRKRRLWLRTCRHSRSEENHHWFFKEARLLDRLNRKNLQWQLTLDCNS